MIEGNFTRTIDADQTNMSPAFAALVGQTTTPQQYAKLIAEMAVLSVNMVCPVIVRRIDK